MSYKLYESLRGKNELLFNLYLHTGAPLVVFSALDQNPSAYSMTFHLCYRENPILYLEDNPLECCAGLVHCYYDESIKNLSKFTAKPPGKNLADLLGLFDMHIFLRDETSIELVAKYSFLNMKKDFRSLSSDELNEFRHYLDSEFNTHPTRRRTIDPLANPNGYFEVLSDNVEMKEH